MLKLVGVDLLGAFLFGGLYSLAATGRMPESLFQPAIVAAGVGYTWLWVLIEAEANAGFAGLKRAGRVAGAFAITVFVVPAAVLGVIGGLREGLEPGTMPAGIDRRASLLVLVALFATGCANLLGGFVAFLRARPRPPGAAA